MITDKDSIIRRNTVDQSLLEVISLAAFLSLKAF